MAGIRLIRPVVIDAAALFARAAQGLPPSSCGPLDACGSATVAAAHDAVRSSVDRALVAAAAELVRVGSGARQAVSTLADADARLASRS